MRTETINCDCCGKVCKSNEVNVNFEIEIHTKRRIGASDAPIKCINSTHNPMKDVCRKCVNAIKSNAEERIIETVAHIRRNAEKEKNVVS